MRHGKTLNLIYEIGATLTFAGVFLGCWIYLVGTFGYVLGISLGWMPSIFAANVCGALWPVVLVLFVVIGSIFYF